MREFKFRVWHPILDKFIYFGLDSFSYSDRYLYDDKYPVQQYTGLKDINNKEIYEGDILKDIPTYEESQGGQIGPSIDIVSFEYGSFYWGNYPLNDFIQSEMSAAQDCPYLEDIEIIGNMFENSELLK